MKSMDQKPKTKPKSNHGIPGMKRIRKKNEKNRRWKTKSNEVDSSGKHLEGSEAKMRLRTNLNKPNGRTMSDI